MQLRGVRLLLVDGPNLIRRVHAAVPGADSTEKIEHSVTACLSSLQRALSRHEPTHVLCAYESGGETWRHRLYADYKKDRPPLSAELQEIFELARQRFVSAGVAVVQADGMEADDIIASAALRAAAGGAAVTVLSTDTGQAQLLGPRIAQYDHFHQRPIDAEYIEQRFGVQPRQLPDYLALVGDSSHSLPGVSGIGAKSAARLLGQYPDLDAIIAAADQIGGRQAQALRDQQQQARLVRQLATLRSDVSLGTPLRDFRYPPDDAVPADA